MMEINQFKNQIMMGFPPAVLEVVEIMLKNPPIITSKEISSKTKYSSRTVRDALFRLKQAQFVTQIADLNDARKCFWVLSIK